MAVMSFPDFDLWPRSPPDPRSTSGASGLEMMSRSLSDLTRSCEMSYESLGQGKNMGAHGLF